MTHLINTHPISKKTNKLIAVLGLLTINGLFFNLSYAQSTITPTNLRTVSYGEIKSNISDETREAIKQQGKSMVIVDQFIGKASAKTRQEIKQNKQTSANKALSFIVDKSAKLTHAPLSSRTYQIDYDFTIYSATSYLDNDLDGDGYFPTFSVTFDADINSYYGDLDAYVYAELYLSKNGGDWVHYYTTDDFLIHGNTTQDQYEVITTLVNGYSPDEYDVLIDLYEVGYSDVIATYSSDDSNQLYALPLESSDYDEPYIEVIEIVHGGSFSFSIILYAILLLSLRIGKNA